MYCVISRSVLSVYTSRPPVIFWAPRFCFCAVNTWQSLGHEFTLIITSSVGYLPVPVAARSKAWVCGRSSAEIVGSNSTGGRDICIECCVLSGRGLCDELITRPEESYRLWCVVVCDLETSWMGSSWPAGGCSSRNQQTNINNLDEAYVWSLIFF